MTYPPKFQLDGPRLLDLLTGKRFYEDVDAALREAILNSIDACGRWEQVADDYDPSIQVVFDQSNHRVEVADNGDGMDRENLAELFAKVGSSARDVLSADQGGDYESVGEFGIGVVSYFLVADRFEVHTRKETGEAIGLEFSREMFDMEKQAKQIEPQRDERGTTLLLDINESAHFQRLLERFPYWIRDVPYLEATKEPDGTSIDQGGRRAHVSPVDLEATPDWVEHAEIGPPVELDVWKALDGQAHIDVLYRGVYVQALDVPRLWGIEGSLHVNPRKFKAKLNRESFLKEGFEPEIQKFLQSVHPLVLSEALDNLREAIEEGEVEGWGLRKWTTIWLAVPRSGQYREVAAAWDDEFLGIEAFKILGAEAKERASLADIKEKGGERIYLAPSNLGNAGALVKKATSILRAQGAIVIQGLSRDNSYLRGANLQARSSSELLRSHLSKDLPPVQKVEDVAESILSEHASLTHLFTSDPPVLLVQLGSDAAPLAKVGNELWLNIESEKGRRITLETCDRNEGYLGLFSACQTHSPGHIGQLVPLLKRVTEPMLRLGSVRRQYIRWELG